MIKRMLSLCLALMLALALLAGCTARNNAGANMPDGANGGVIDRGNANNGTVLPNDPNATVPPGDVLPDNGNTLPDDGLTGGANEVTPNTPAR